MSNKVSLLRNIVILIILGVLSVNNLAIASSEINTNRKFNFVAAGIGQNSAFYFFGYHLQGIILGYIAGYAAAGFTTFMTILGRYDLNTSIDSCCSVLEQQSNKGFLPNLFTTFKNFWIGVSKLSTLHRQSNIKHILKSSLIILVTAETACILTAETVDLIFYKQSMLLSISLAVLSGTLAVVRKHIKKQGSPQV